MKDIVIASAVRTPVGSIGGTLKNVEPDFLLAAAFEEAIVRAGIQKKDIDHVIAGHVKQSTEQPNIARLTALEIRIPEEVPAYTVHRQCASGMQAIHNGMMEIQCGYADIVLCGGVESMSTAPFYIKNTRFGTGNGTTKFLDPNVESQPNSQPKDIYGSFNMIQTADKVAKIMNITREECDAFALRSQTKAIAAIDEGRMAEEIVPVVIPQRKGDPIVFDTDEFPKRNTNAEKLAKLKPIFEGGVTTAGNASGRNDGACALVIMSAEKAEEMGIKPMAKIIGVAAAGVDPTIMGVGPIYATRKLLETALKEKNIGLDDFDLIELNEAFAAQSLGCIKELGLDIEKVNVNGGAIALGHPLGCSGARIVTTLLYELKRRGGRYGLATLCIGGGLGMAMAVERM